MPQGDDGLEAHRSAGGADAGSKPDDHEQRRRAGKRHRVHRRKAEQDTREQLSSGCGQQQTDRATGDDKPQALPQDDAKDVAGAGTERDWMPNSRIRRFTANDVTP